MSEEIGTAGEIQPSVLNASEHMKPGAANISDAACINGPVLAAAQREMLIIAKLLQLKHECFAHGGAAGYGAMPRSSGNESARRARIDKLLRHNGSAA